MFLWRGSHVILVLVMVLICGMALTHPAWAYLVSRYLSSPVHHGGYLGASLRPRSEVNSDERETSFCRASIQASQNR
jgi:hypothetical protein